METTAIFSVNLIGGETGTSYMGDFTVKTILSRRDRFVADERRRAIIGSLAEGALPALQTEAFMLGQLSIRIVKSPDWWSQNGNGLDLADADVIAQVFNLAIEKENQRREEVKKQAEEALKQLKG